MTAMDKLDKAIEEAKSLGFMKMVSRETSDKPRYGTSDYRRWWHRQNAFSSAWLSFKQRSDARARKRMEMK